MSQRMIRCYTVNLSSLSLSLSLWLTVRIFSRDNHKLGSFPSVDVLDAWSVRERKGTPGGYQGHDLFIKVLSVLCPNLTDSSLSFHRVCHRRCPLLALDHQPREKKQRLSRSLSRFETQDIKTQPQFNHYQPWGGV